MSWQGALEYWAEQAGCSELSFDQSSQFARVWTYSVIYALVMTIGITVPFRWCSREKAAIKIHHEPDEDPEEGIDPATPHTVKTNKTTNTYKTYNVEASDPTPNLEEARKHLVHTSATQHHKWMSPLCTPTYRLSEVGGTGTELYFRTLRNMAFIFAYMAGITGPLVAFCWLGNFGPDTGQFLLKTTIGNLGEYADADIIDPIQRVVRLGCEGMPLKDLTGIFGWLDFSAVLVFLVYLIWARFWQIPRMAEADDMEQVTPKDYAVVIESLPAQIPDQAQYEQKLTEHLLERLRYTRGRRPSPWELPEPTVEEVVLVRDYKGRLHELTERAQLEINVGIAEAHAKGKPSKKVDKLKKQLEKLEEKLGAKLDGEEFLPVVRAYVILNNTEDVQNLLFDYRFAKYKLFRCCQFRARRFEGTAIRVTRAPQPTDIIWENQDIGFFNRLLRQIFVFFVFFVILSVSIAFIYLTTVASKATSKTQVSYLGVPACDPVSEDQFDINGNEPYQCMIQNAMNWTMDYAVGEGGDILSCWCTALGYQAILSNGDYMTACGPWFIELGTTIAIATGSSVIVTVINLVLQLIIQYLAEFERPLSHTALNSSMIQKAFWAQTLNTGFVLFVVNYFAPKALREAVLALPGVGFLLFRGPFAELTRGWYALVGVTLVTNMVINMFVPASVTIAKLFVTSLKRWCLRGRVAHQAELIELYTNPEFDIKVKMLHIALGICNDAPDKQLGYVCAGGVYMEYWKSRGDDWRPKYDYGAALSSSSRSVIHQDWAKKAQDGPSSDPAWLFEHICLFTDFPATCFRFEPGLGVQEERQSFREFENVAIFEPCTQSYWSSNITWTQKPLRGCILGRSFHLYQDYDFWCHGRYAIETAGRKSGLQRLNSLADWCSMYEPSEDGASLVLSNKTRTLKTKFPLQPLLRTYGNWLACIAGSMASVAFVEAWAEPGPESQPRGVNERE
eukprot:s272_g4.t1